MHRWLQQFIGYIILAGKKSCAGPARCDRIENKSAPGARGKEDGPIALGFWIGSLVEAFLIAAALAVGTVLLAVYFGKRQEHGALAAAIAIGSVLFLAAVYLGLMVVLMGGVA